MIERNGGFFEREEELQGHAGMEERSGNEEYAIRAGSSKCFGYCQYFAEKGICAGEGIEICRRCREEAAREAGKKTCSEIHRHRLKEGREALL